MFFESMHPTWRTWLAELEPELRRLEEVTAGSVPPKEIVMRAFETDPTKTRVVLLGQDPYPTLGVADGIAFSCSKSEKEQPSLRFILDEVEKLYPEGYKRPLDLSKWSRQGILMLNTALTVYSGLSNSHSDDWAPFTEWVFDKIFVSWQKKLLNQHTKLIPLKRDCTPQSVTLSIPHKRVELFGMILKS